MQKQIKKNWIRLFFEIATKKMKKILYKEKAMLYT